VLSKLKLTRQNNLTVLLRYVIRLDVIGHLAMSDFARLIYHTSGRGLSRYCSFGGMYRSLVVSVMTCCGGWVSRLLLKFLGAGCWVLEIPLIYWFIFYIGTSSAGYRSHRKSLNSCWNIMYSSSLT